MKLLDQLRRAIRVRHYSIRTEHSYVEWVKEYVFGSSLFCVVSGRNTEEH